MVQTGMDQRSTAVTWDLGTAYDLFLSLQVLHEPSSWQLRGSWAAGVRSRLSSENRSFFRENFSILSLPAGWITSLSAPKNGAAVLAALEQSAPRDRLAVLLGFNNASDTRTSPLNTIFQRIQETGRWTDADLDEAYDGMKQHGYARKQVKSLFRLWSDTEGTGQKILAALQEYYDVFFAEEEDRISPFLKSALHKAQQLAAGLNPQALVEELALGLKYEQFPAIPELVLAPSFWAAPLLVFGRISDSRHLILFGGRPESESLVPGEVVPDLLSRGLKALADPTRLRILRYLSHEPQTPAQLARKLRLRPPTVVHHLHTLRLAQLVEITLTAEEQRRYTIRSDGLNNVSASLVDFLDKK